jgi:hypothetical protein
MDCKTFKPTLHAYERILGLAIKTKDIFNVSETRGVVDASPRDSPSKVV